MDKDKKKNKMPSSEVKNSETSVAGKSINEENYEEYIKVNLRAKYLPDILVKLGECSANVDSRRLIRNFGIIINDAKTKDIDYFLVKGSSYRIIVNENKYLITLI